MGFDPGWMNTAITVGIWLITIGFAWAKFGGRVDMIDLRLKNMEETNKLIAETLKEFNHNDKELALLKQQHITLAKDYATLHEIVEAMRRGEGFITGPRRGNVEGEYPSRMGYP